MAFNWIEPAANCLACSGRAKQVLKVLCDAAQDKVRQANYYGEEITAEPGDVWLSHSAIGLKSGMSKESAKRGCNDLVELGLTSVVRKGGCFDGINKTTIYRVDIDAVENAPARKKEKRKERGLHPGKGSSKNVQPKTIRVPRGTYEPDWDEKTKRLPIMLALAGRDLLTVLTEPDNYQRYGVDWEEVDMDRAKVLSAWFWDILSRYKGDYEPRLLGGTNWVNAFYDYLHMPEDAHLVPFKDSKVGVMDIYHVLATASSKDDEHDLNWSYDWMTECINYPGCTNTPGVEPYTYFLRHLREITTALEEYLLEKATWANSEGTDEMVMCEACGTSVPCLEYSIHTLNCREFMRGGPHKFGHRQGGNTERCGGCGAEIPCLEFNSHQSGCLEYQRDCVGM